MDSLSIRALLPSKCSPLGMEDEDCLGDLALLVRQDFHKAFIVMVVRTWSKFTHSCKVS